MRNSKLVLMSLVIAGGFVGSSIVAAQDTSPASASQTTTAAQSSKTAAAPQDYSFAALDKHHHGYLVRSDIPHSMRNLRLHFGEADYDHNDRLSPAEYAAYQQRYNDNIDTQQANSGQVSANATALQNAQQAAQRQQEQERASQGH